MNKKGDKRNGVLDVPRPFVYTPLPSLIRCRNDGHNVLHFISGCKSFYQLRCRNCFSYSIPLCHAYLISNEYLPQPGGKMMSLSWADPNQTNSPWLMHSVSITVL